jgi:hypothetical protein
MTGTQRTRKALCQKQRWLPIRERIGDSGEPKPHRPIVVMACQYNQVHVGNVGTSGVRLAIWPMPNISLEAHHLEQTGLAGAREGDRRQLVDNQQYPRWQG